MSTYFDDASLVMIPSGYKDDKLYSIKPTSGDGDFTFSRDGSGASPATRVNSAGLIEKGRTNLLLQSNNFDTSWSTYNASRTSGAADFEGGNNAWTLTKTGSYGLINQYVANTGVHTFSIYAKAGSLDWIALTTSQAPYSTAYFDLENGVVGSLVNAIDSNIESVGGGWYRCSLTSNVTAAGNWRIYPADSDGGLSNANLGNVIIYKAQLEKGLVATSYIETTTAAASAGILGDMPRLDYSGGATCPSLLLEPARTNILTQSEYLDAYVKSRATITSNAATSPEGVTNASKIIPLSTSNGWAGVNAPNYSFTSGDTYTLSVFAKAGEYNYCQVGGSTPAFPGSFATINLTNGVVEHQSGITATTEDYGNGWYRISFTHTAISTASSPIGFFAVYSTAVSSRLATQVGDNVSGVYAWGWQAELASYPTSYVPSYGSATARNQCFANKTGISSLIGQTEGTLFLDFKLPKIATPQNHTWVALKDSPQNNRILVYFLANSETLRAQIKASGTANNFNLGTISNGDRVKIAIAYKSGDSAIYVNGSSSATSTNTLSFGTMDIIDFTDSSAPFEGYANQMLVFPTRLTNAELESLTTI